jgi:hypothetical protein
MFDKTYLNYESFFSPEFVKALYAVRCPAEQIGQPNISLVDHNIRWTCVIHTTVCTLSRVI